MVGDHQSVKRRLGIWLRPDRWALVSFLYFIDSSKPLARSLRHTHKYNVLSIESQNIQTIVIQTKIKCLFLFCIRWMGWSTEQQLLSYASNLKLNNLASVEAKVSCQSTLQQNIETSRTKLSALWLDRASLTLSPLSFTCRSSHVRYNCQTQHRQQLYSYISQSYANSA
jgi:hypothetical protein